MSERQLKDMIGYVEGLENRIEALETDNAMFKLMVFKMFEEITANPSFIRSYEELYGPDEEDDE